MKGHFLALLMTLAFYSSSLHGSIVSTPSSAEQKRIEEFRSKLLKSLERGNTPDQSPDQSPASTHELFKTHQAALDWAISVSERLAKGSSAKIFNVLPLTDSRYPELQKMVGEIWLGYTDLFPEFTQGLNEPPVILVESEVINAFVPQAIIHENRIAHAVVIFTPLVDLAGGPGNRDLMSGVIGHELAHSVFRHLLPDYKKGIRKFYDPKSSRFGFESKRNSELDKAFESWVESATLAGDLTPAELENLPSQGIGTPFLMKLWTEMYAQLSEDSSACKTAQDSFQTWTSFQINSEFAQEITINPEILPEINLASDRLIDQYNTCFKGRNKSVYVLLSKILGIPAADLENIPDIQDLASVYGSGATPMEGLQKLVKPARDSMMEIEKNYPLKAYQFFSEEEHADDVSLIVHKHLGWDQLSLVNFFRLLLSEDARQKCDALLKAGTLPPGGSFSDPHRATCYRMSHIVDLKNAYQKMDSRAFAADYISKTIQPQ